ncbi:MAG: YebC/PmpR family DNA-binding transcriptional regulator [Bacteroidetes bacterium]|nr:YebC/PmpR family DNA-binding transcriptional regulator [Bacteroidota bacterium]
MGRVFEKRKHVMFARFDRMSKGFTRIGKEISMAVKQNGPLPENNPRLRMAMQAAKAINMPKDRVEAAIKRASSKDESDLEEIAYHGKAPHGIVLIIECATNNTTRTVSNLRTFFNRGGGELGKMGANDYFFEHKGVFRIKGHGIDTDELELEGIDFGLDELMVDGDELLLYTIFSDYGTMQKFIEDKNFTIVSAEKQRIPNNTVDLSEGEANEVLELIEKIEADDDIQHVYHNLA